MSKKEKIVVRTPNSINGYEIRGTIGSGAFSVVKLAYHVETKTYYACKVIVKERISTQKRYKRFESEIRIQQQLHHPGIVKVCDLFADENNYYIILEFCTSGELLRLIVDKGKLAEKEAKSIIYQILEALSYIHSVGICHRDIKLENILIDQTGKVKLSDFGLSRFASKPDFLVTTPCGSPCYASPECISGHVYNGQKSDMWSVGIMIYASVVGQLPWTKRNQSELFKQIKAADYTIPSFITEECADLLKKILTTNTEERLTAEEAMLHPWFDDRIEGTFPDIGGKTMDISLKHIDKFFVNYDDNYSKVSLTNFISDSDINTFPKILHRIKGEFIAKKFRDINFIPQLPPTAYYMALSSTGRTSKASAKLTKPVLNRYSSQKFSSNKESLTKRKTKRMTSLKRK